MDDVLVKRSIVRQAVFKLVSLTSDTFFCILLVFSPLYIYEKGKKGKNYSINRGNTEQVPS